MRNKKRELEAAPEGTFTTEQRWLLGRELLQMEWLEQQAPVMETGIEQRVAGFKEQLRRLHNPGSGARYGLDHSGRSGRGRASV